MFRRAIAAIVLVVLLGTAPLARAEVIKGDGVVVGTVVLGTLGGISSSIAAAVYSLDRRTFETGWVIGSLISSSICGATAMSFAINGDWTYGGEWTALGFIFYLGLTVWPGYWTVRTALEDVDPGERYEAEVAEEPSVDPEAALKPRLPSNPTAFSLSWSF